MPNPTLETSPSSLAALGRGLRRRCPRCGRGKLFEGWYDLKDRCSACDLDFDPEPGSTWLPMYASTAFLTGLFILAMLLIRPANPWVGRLVVAVAAAAMLLGTLPHRKGIAIALDFLLRRRFP